MNVRNVKIDFFKHEVCGFKVGDRLAFSMRCLDESQTNELVEVPSTGVEIGKKEGRLDYVFVTIQTFAGNFYFNSIPVFLKTSDHVLQLLGEPYWSDSSDGELIYFYEYENGCIETQFEFHEDNKLAFVTISDGGVMGDEMQRKVYGVDKRWPP